MRQGFKHRNKGKRGTQLWGLNKKKTKENEKREGKKKRCKRGRMTHEEIE